MLGLGCFICVREFARVHEHVEDNLCVMAKELSTLF